MKRIMILCSLFICSGRCIYSSQEESDDKYLIGKNPFRVCIISDYNPLSTSSSLPTDVSWTETRLNDSTSSIPDEVIESIFRLTLRSSQERKTCEELRAEFIEKFKKLPCNEQKKILDNGFWQQCRDVEIVTGPALIRPGFKNITPEEHIKIEQELKEIMSNSYKKHAEEML